MKTLLLFALAASAMPQNLELRIRPESIVKGIPQAFTFSLVNVSDHDVRVPTPAVQCEDSFDGSISLNLFFTPDGPASEREGRGCAGDTFGRPSITDRIQKWTLLRAGDGLTLTLPRERLFYDDKEPGIYEFWAEYVPPSVLPAERQQLQKAGIDFPRVKLKSSHIAFRKSL